MRPRAMSLILAVLSMSVTVTATVTATENPLIGTWKINLGKSTFSPGPRPMGSIVIFEAKGRQIVQSVNNVGAQGNKIIYSVTYAFDGKDYPVKGDPYTLEATNKKDGKVTTHQTRIIAKDGKIFTLTTTGATSQGQPVKNVEIYEKQ